MPSNRGISSGVTTSTTIASGHGTSNGFALTTSSPTTRAPKWPMAETIKAWANVSLQSIHIGFKSISPPRTEIIHHLSSPLLDDEASKLRILDYLRKWLGDKLEDMPANRA